MTTTSERLIEKLDLAKFFDEMGHQWNLVLGTIQNQGGTRVVYLSSDVIRGVYNALEYEAGEAWKIILRNCGLFWGRRVAANLDRELSLLFQTGAKDLPVSEYVRFLEAYFRFHGWGVMEIDLSRAVSHGVVTGRLKNSIFENVLADVEGPVDYMIEGMLRAMFEHIAGTPLDCVQIASQKSGAPQCEFVITSVERVDEVRPHVEGGTSPDEVYALLCE